MNIKCSNKKLTSPPQTIIHEFIEFCNYETQQKYLLFLLKNKYKISEIDLLYTDIIIPQICPYIHTKLSFKNKNNRNCYTIERIDITGKCTKDNIIVLSVFANIMLHNLNLDILKLYYINILKLIVPKFVCLDNGW